MTDSNPLTDSVSTDVEDRALVARAASGDREALHELVQGHQAWIYNIAVRMLAHPQDAEDATQETFTSIWRSASSYRADRGSGAPWLYAVARNAIVDRARARSETPTEVPDEASLEPGPPDEAERSWLAWRVHRAMQELPEHERPLLELAYWSGLSQSEIADFLNIPLGTVKTRTRSALGRLADALEELH